MIRKSTDLKADSQSQDCTKRTAKPPVAIHEDMEVGTSENSSGSTIATRKSEQGTNKPFLLRPAAKDYLWGGQRLNDDFSKSIPLNPLAETWECSTHPDGSSVVASGEFAGMTLTEVLISHPEFLGTHPSSVYHTEEHLDNPLPILVKFIDAKKDLSIQVHPSDDYARIHENGQLGKTEMWYVIDAEPGSRLVYGFKESVTTEQVSAGAADGSIENLLQYVDVHKGDVFFIEPGTVHAIGRGILLAEIQESSNLTYRLYDYGRTDKNGHMRELHITKALDVVNLERSVSPRQPIRKLSYKPGVASELIGRCKYFEVERILINTERIRSMVSVASTSESFEVLLCIDGCADMFGAGDSGDGHTGSFLNIFKGDCVFIPADSEPLKLHGRTEFLRIRC